MIENDRKPSDGVALSPQELRRREEELQKREEVLSKKSREEEARKMEEAELDAYMDASHAAGTGPSEADRVAFLRKRYQEVREDYKTLHLQKEEAETRGNRQLQQVVHEGFRDNYKVRKWCVVELRKLGEKVDDPFVPASRIQA